MQENIISKPFSWNDKLAEEAQETLEALKIDIGYCAYMTLGMALAKLELLEKQGAKVNKPSVQE